MSFDATPIVYFIKAKTLGLVKVGKTSRGGLQDRINSLQTGSPDELFVLGIVLGDREKEIHQRFNYLRHHGEWFRLDSTLEEFIRVETIDFPAIKSFANKWEGAVFEWSWEKKFSTAPVLKYHYSAGK